MASKKHSTSTPPLPKFNNLARGTATEIIDLLRGQLAAANEREKELLRQLAAKDDQIRLVLEEKFFHPVLTRAAEPPKANTAIHGADIVDSTQFPTDGDKDAIAKEEKAATEAREKFDADLAEIEAEHVAAHQPQYEDLPLETKAAAQPAEESLRDA